MKRIGLTGNIGTGKSTVARIFEILGISVYHADISARSILNTDEVKAILVKIFGQNILFSDGVLNRKALAEIVFNDAEKLTELNKLIHPLVETDFKNWCYNRQNEKYIIHEAAILFESGFNRMFDSVILVTAPEDLCISRVMQRDQITKEMVMERMNNQWSQDEKMKLAEYHLVNDGISMIIPQVIRLHNYFLKN